MAAKKKRIRWLVAVAALVILTVWIAWGNEALELNAYTIQSQRLPEAFDGYRICHVSDLHNAQMGKNNEKLITMLREAAPDMIVITGDLIDSRRTDMDVALAFVQEAVKIAPCWYVTGNHESRISEYGELKAAMEEAGVTVLNDMCDRITREGASIKLIGVNDPKFLGRYWSGDAETLMDTALTQLHTDEKTFTILLSHRPELFPVYASHGIDLVFSGHAHGGQFRLPFVGGVLVPNQGFFPKYDAGLFTQENTNMIVSRGIGNSLFPFRVNNPPEVILIKLQTG